MFLVLKTISFLFLESVVESYHLERPRQQEDGRELVSLLLIYNVLVQC